MRTLFRLTLMLLGGAANVVHGFPAPVYVTYHPGIVDYLYTTSASERDSSLPLGYLDYGIAFHIETSAVSGSAPFKRYFKGAPQHDHFYTVIPADQTIVLKAGWGYEGITGHIHTSQVSGTSPLYRASKWNSANGDLAHFYTTSVQQLNSYVASGWVYDHGTPEGYVFPPADPPNSVFVSAQVPSNLRWNESATVQVTFKNTGTGQWTSSFGLASNGLTNDWNVTFVPLTTIVPSGSSGEFNFTIRAPLCPYTASPAQCDSSILKTFSWQMSTGQTKFGPTYSAKISVGNGSEVNNNPPGPPPAIVPTIFPSDHPNF